MDTPFYWHNHHPEWSWEARLQPAIEAFVSEHGELPALIYVNPQDSQNLPDQVMGVDTFVTNAAPQGNFALWAESAVQA